MSTSLHDKGIPFAFRYADQRMVTPQDVPKGLRCGCVCKECGAALIARKGPERVWHFAHHARGACPDGFETAVHWMAKQLIVGRTKVWVPARAQQRRVTGWHGVWTETLSVDVQLAGVVSLSNCIQEQTVASAGAPGVRRPDISAMFNGQPIAIEIYNTHAVDEEKLEWLMERGLSTLEIKVSDLPASGAEAIIDALERRLFRPSHFSEWLVHVGDAAALTRLDDDERTLRAAKAGEEAALLVERSRQIARNRRQRQFRDDVRELEYSTIPFGARTTLRISRSRIRCTVKWYGYPAGQVVQAVRELACKFSGRFNPDATRWEYYRSEDAETLYAQILEWIDGHRSPLPGTQVINPHQAPADTSPPASAASSDPNEQEHFDERAAIMEFDGRLSRMVAEERAYEELSRTAGRHSQSGLSGAAAACS